SRARARRRAPGALRRLLPPFYGRAAPDRRRGLPDRALAVEDGSRAGEAGRLLRARCGTTAADALGLLAGQAGVGGRADRGGAAAVAGDPVRLTVGEPGQPALRAYARLALPP